MIKSLFLNGFGRHKNQTFAFGKVTIFRGDNESGKTTIHDAIFKALCSPKGASLAAKTLRARYGSDAATSIAFDGETKPIIEESMFRDLLSIRSGEIVLLAPEHAKQLAK